MVASPGILESAIKAVLIRLIELAHDAAPQSRAEGAINALFASPGPKPIEEIGRNQERGEEDRRTEDIEDVLPYMTTLAIQRDRTEHLIIIGEGRISRINADIRPQRAESLIGQIQPNRHPALVVMDDMEHRGARKMLSRVQSAVKGDEWPAHRVEKKRLRKRMKPHIA